MPRGGNNRKPKDSKIIQGTFRKDRNPANEPDPPKVDEVPRAPSHLNRWAKRWWKQQTPVLLETGVLRTVDLPSLETVAELYGQYRESQDAVYHCIDEETGARRKRSLAEYMAGRNSQTMPEYTAMTKALASYRAAAAEFGLSPVSRNRVDLREKGDEKDLLEEMIAGGR